MTNIVIISLKIIKCIMEHVEKNIRNIRELKDITQEHIATQLGISTRAYSRIETGETQLTINRLNEISKILNVTPQEVIGFDEKQIFNNCKQSGNIGINHIAIPERLIQQYEKRIQFLEEELIFIKSLIPNKN